MSVNRENVTWQSADGSWSRGFYEFYDVNTGDPDWDFEWDVEYDYSAFNWVSQGHPSADAANESWRGANPGGSCAVSYTPENAAECDRLDQLARTLKEEERRREAELRKQGVRLVRWP